MNISRLRAARLSSGKSLRQLARDCGCSPSYISKVETGREKVESVSAELAMRWRSAIDASLALWGEIFTEQRAEIMLNAGHFDDIDNEWQLFIARRRGSEGGAT